MKLNFLLFGLIVIASNLCSSQVSGPIHIRSNGSESNPQFYLEDNDGQLGLKIWQETPPSRNVHFDLVTADHVNGNMIFGVKSFSSSIQFNTGLSTSYQTRMVINKYGNVIIGNPNMINNAYLLNVGGMLRANEVIINTTGADYVFQNDYVLKPIEDVEKFILENKHLPEVPSAKEMQKHGMKVSDFNTKMLEKIEELTLYIIQQNKDIVKLKEEIDILKNK